MPQHPWPQAWPQRYPDRWRQELAALTTAGWTHEVVFDEQPGRGRQPVIRLTYPTPTGDWPGTGMNLTVRFPTEYPFFPPQVTLEDAPPPWLRRHYTPATGALCLLEAADWHLETTVADLLLTQLPRLLAANNPTGTSPDTDETRAAIPVASLLTHRRVLPALLLPDHPPIPASTRSGAFLARIAVDRTGRVDTGAVEHLLGEHYRWSSPAPPALRAYSALAVGCWLRDPDFDPLATAHDTWQRLEPRLEPIDLDIDTESTRKAVLPADFLELVLLLVSGETGYRTRGEEWVGLLRHHTQERTGTDYLLTQPLGRTAREARSPLARHVAQSHVVVVGVGAIGHHVASDLARAGIARLDLVDGDLIDLATGSRQFTPLICAGRSKATTLADALAASGTPTRLRGFHHHLGDVPDTLCREAPAHPATSPETLHTALESADLVIDATANPAATTYLNALRARTGDDLLHVSATAGGWGGVVHLTTPATGCWSCLQHHRADRALPVPPADPAGTTAPPGCAEPTFTGTNPDLATIAHHASRVALHRLAHQPGLGGDLYIASQHDQTGPHPTRWTSVPVPVHPDCPHHQRAAVAHLTETPDRARPAWKKGRRTATAHPGTDPENSTAHTTSNCSPRADTGTATHSEHEGGEPHRSRVAAPGAGPATPAPDTPRRGHP